MKQDINKKGYFTLEAAIVLPIFVIGILSIGYCMKIFSTAETITYSMMDETGHLAAQAYGKPVAPGFPAELKQRLREENERIRHIKITEFQYRHSGRGKTDLIKMCIRDSVGGTSFLLPFLQEYMHGIEANFIAAGITCLFMIPLINIMCSKKSVLYTKLWLKSQANRMPLLAFTGMRIVISCGFIVMTLRKLLHLPYIPLIVLSFAAIVFIVKSDYIKRCV